eukprot:TRINITY_DN1128_c0_g1_i3.p1 TRINITY_DN1128_c0_g1~~TRINITY_DN1128_c0_g1_i3.p1  ORF type:complete len:477 (-),score=76.53 TRINITY_DN1128_c0_g1_i3:276-1706(-)
MSCGNDNGEYCDGNSCNAFPRSSSCSSSYCENSAKISRPQAGDSGNLRCSKCKEKKSQIKANQTELLCGDCLHSSILSKFKTSVNNHGMLLPGDKVLLGFSGGPSSRVALEFVRDIQAKARRDAKASREDNMHMFNFGVIFVDESSALHIDPSESHQLAEEVKSVVASNAHADEKMHFVTLESVFSENGYNDRLKLLDLLESIHDTTSKEDMIGYLRMEVLQKVAAANGYNKLMLGTNASRIAVRVVSSTVKGQGYSLPADVHYIDARWKVPVVLPLRDCVVKELAMLCHLKSWKTVIMKNSSTFGGPYHSINTLVASFVSLLQEENPSRERTIVRTAEKLNPFSFRKLPETTAIQHLPRRRRESLKNCMSTGISNEQLCPICSGPLNEKDDTLNSSLLPLSLNEGIGYQDLPLSIFKHVCCPTCQFQMLGDTCLSKQNIHLLLPEMMQKRALNNVVSNRAWKRCEIEDCLLSDDS